MKKNWRGKPLNGRYPQRTDNGNVDQSTPTNGLAALGFLKAEIELFILMAHDQTISTRVYQSRILKTGANPKYRLCKNNKETVDHIISGCSIIVNT